MPTAAAPHSQSTISSHGTYGKHETYRRNERDGNYRSHRSYASHKSHPLLPPTLLLLLLLPFTALAATLTATLDRDLIGANQAATLTVTLEGANDRAVPRIPEVPGLRLTRTGSGMRLELRNGRQMVFNETTYQVAPTRTGEFTLGPFTAIVGNTTLTTDPLRLRVVPANDPALAQSEAAEVPAFLTLNVPPRPVYVGESIVTETHLYVAAPYAAGGRVVQAPQVHADGSLVGPVQDGGQDSNVRTNNRPHTRVRFLQSLTPARAGQLTLQSTQCLVDVQIRSRRPLNGFFDDTLFGFSETRRLSLASDPYPLLVLDLPSTNVPSHFLGAVGDFEISWTASPTQVAAGQPVTVRVEIRGTGNFDAVLLPDQPQWDGFRAYPAQASFQPADALGLSGVKRFEQVVSPEHADLQSLPPLVFSYFSPTTHSYHTLRTPPIPLQVTPSAHTPTLPALAANSDANSTPPPTAPALQPHLGSALPLHSPPSTPAPWILLAAALPWSLWFGLRLSRFCRHYRRHDPQTQWRHQIRREITRCQRQLAQFESTADPAPFHTTLFRLLQHAVALQTNQAPASVTEGSLDDPIALQRFDPAVLATLHRLFQACNQARYAGQEVTSDLRPSLHRDAVDLLRSLRPD